MGRYRRLNNEHAEKLNRYKKFGNKMLKMVKWVSVLSVIAVLIIGATIVFYVFVDGKGKGSISSSFDSYAQKNMDDNETLTDEEKNAQIEGEIVQKDSQDNQEDSTAQTDGNKGYEKEFSKWNDSCSAEMIVVNKDNLIPKKFKVKTKICRGKEVGADISENLEKMISDAKKDGIILWISSGYRSVERQTMLFNRQVQREKNKGLSEQEAEKSAQSVVAKPYTSEHNTGLAVDFNGVEDDFYKTKEYQWLLSHSAEYGFIERYPKKDQSITGVIYEPWHFRYVGKENAIKIKESGLCLEEYVRSLNNQ